MRTGRCVVREKRGSQQLPPVFPWPGGLSMAPGHNRASPALLEGELSEAPAVWAVEWAWGGRVLSQGRTEVELPLSPDLSDPSPASPVTLHSVPRGTLQRGCRTPDSQLPTVCPQLGPLPLGLGPCQGVGLEAPPLQVLHVKASAQREVTGTPPLKQIRRRRKSALRSGRGQVLLFDGGLLSTRPECSAVTPSWMQAGMLPAQEAGSRGPCRAWPAARPACGWTRAHAACVPCPAGRGAHRPCLASSGGFHFVSLVLGSCFQSLFSGIGL